VVRADADAWKRAVVLGPKRQELPNTGEQQPASFAFLSIACTRQSGKTARNQGAQNRVLRA
jgi:hypothetical protein